MPSKRPVESSSAYDAHLAACRRLVAGSVFDREHQVTLTGSILDFQLPCPRGPLPLVRPAASQAHSCAQDKSEPVMGYVMRVSRVDLTWERLIDRRMVAAIRKWAAVFFKGPASF